MIVLRRALVAQATLWSILGFLLAAAPRFLLTTALGQPPYEEYAWIRLLGVHAVALSLLMVLVARRLQELWWWSWAFVLASGATALIVTLNAVFGLPEGAAAWPWWGLAALSWTIALTMAWGLARSGQENPIV